MISLLSIERAEHAKLVRAKCFVVLGHVLHACPGLACRRRAKKRLHAWPASWHAPQLEDQGDVLLKGCLSAMQAMMPQRPVTCLTASTWTTAAPCPWMNLLRGGFLTTTRRLEVTSRPPDRCFRGCRAIFPSLAQPRATGVAPLQCVNLCGILRLHDNHGWCLKQPGVFVFISTLRRGCPVSKPEHCNIAYGSTTDNALEP